VLSRIQAKAEAGTRLDRADGLWLLTEAPLLDLGSVAQEARFRRIPELRVTFDIVTNRKYTNV
jgi:2-iminoacetate synthase ThiH